MKNSVLKRLVLPAIVMALLSASSRDKVAVKIRSAPLVFAGPHSPSPRHIQVDGEWVWRRGRYEYANGYRVLPPGDGAVWIPGHWGRR